MDGTAGTLIRENRSTERALAAVGALRCRQCPTVLRDGGQMATIRQIISTLVRTAVACCVSLTLSTYVVLSPHDTLAAQPAAADPEPVTGTDKHISDLETLLAKQPDQVRIRHGLARLYIQKVRENGDASYLTRAETLLAPFLRQTPPPGETVVLYAWLALFKHEFKAAAEWAEKARARQPGESWNYGILSDAALETGDYQKAVIYAQRMMDLKPDQGSYSRAAYLRSLHGDHDGAIELWGSAIRSGARTGEYAAWCRVELGDEYFNAGRLHEAEQAYREALTSFPRYHRSLAGLAKVRAAQHRWADAAELYQNAVDTVPYLPYVAALGDVYQAIGQIEKADQQYQLVEHIAHLDRLNQVLYNRDLALFYADHANHLDEAVRLARKELEVRKDIYSYDVLAWALYRQGRYTEARTAISRALKLGTNDPRLLFHAGMILSATGQDQEAKQYLSRLLSVNPNFHPLHSKTVQETLNRLDSLQEPRPAD
jgi:tetratricopeptide (TPR) repeat protein